MGDDMSYRPGDTYNFLLNIPNTLIGSVGSTPVITIVDMASSTVLVTSATMSNISGTNIVYKYNWTIPSSPAVDDYLAIVSYVANSTTYTNQFLEKLHVGDTYSPGLIAQDSTVAKAATVALAATTLQASSYVSPDSSSTVNAILTAVDALATNLASASSLSSVATQVQDIHDASLGGQTIDKVGNTLTLYKVNSSVLKTFTLTNNSSTASRN